MKDDYIKNDYIYKIENNNEKIFINMKKNILIK